MSNWMIDSSELDTEQTHFLFDLDEKNIWLKGFAGSGKSVLLIYSIRDKIQNNPDVSICVVVFTNSLIQMFTAGMLELKIPEKNVYLTTYHKFKKDNFTYDYIFCDEVQDLPKSILENMRNRSKQLILAGDSNQSIYKTDPSTNEATVTPSEISLITQTNPYALENNYRLTKSIIKLVQKLLPDIDISSKVDNTKDDMSVRLCNTNNEDKEVEYILSEADEAIKIDESVVIILQTHEDIIKFVNLVLLIKNKQQWKLIMDRWGKKPDWFLLNQYLLNSGVNIEYIGNGIGTLSSSVSAGKMIIMTYHSSKGLDFDNVFLPFLHNNRDEWFNNVIFTKTLFMVGMTRSKESLYLTYTGEKHKYITVFIDECTLIDIDSFTNDSDDDLDFDF